MAAQQTDHLTEGGERGARTSSVREGLAATFAGGSMSVPKASDVLAEELRREILAGELPEGAALPVERVLTAQSGLSRNAVREALRILEIEGLVETRPGRAGGSFVRRPGIRSMERSLGVFIAGRRVKFQSLLEVREALEPAGAELAALARTDEDLADLDRASARLDDVFDDVPMFLLRNVEWHVAVVRASHNDLMHAFISSLSQAIHRGTDLEDFNSDRVRTAAVHAHRKVLEAIRAEDAGKARLAMERHVHAYREEVGARGVPEELSLDTDVDTDEEKNR
jgi:DNA-binding FadR family transcriptional regulator